MSLLYSSTVSSWYHRLFKFSPWMIYIFLNTLFMIKRCSFFVSKANVLAEKFKPEHSPSKSKIQSSRGSLSTSSSLELGHHPVCKYCHPNFSHLSSLLKLKFHLSYASRKSYRSDKYLSLKCWCKPPKPYYITDSSFLRLHILQFQTSIYEQKNSKCETNIPH